MSIHLPFEKHTQQKIDEDRSVIIHFMLGHSLPRTVMCDTIVSAYDDIISTIASKGDSVLPKSEDPFVYNKGDGAFIRARSAKGRYLTWSLLEGVMVGLYNGPYLRGRYRASEFLIRDGMAGLLGSGEMRADFVGASRNRTIRWRGMANVEKQNGNVNSNRSSN